MRFAVAAIAMMMLSGCCHVTVSQRDLPEGGTETTVWGSWKTLKIYTSTPAIVYMEAD